MRYTLYEQGPGDHSTYPECWGAHRTSRGRVIATAGRLADLAEAADRIGHENWAVRDHHRRVTLHSDEYWATPTMRALNRKERT